MNQAYYDGMVIRIKGGQYTLDEIDKVIDKAAGAGFFGSPELSSVTVTELKEMARQYIDDSYKGNSEPRAYDYQQDIDILSNTETGIELFDMIMLLMESMPMALSKTEKATFARTIERSEAMMRSAIGDSYVTLILANRRTFDKVHDTKKAEVAEKLIALGRYDLVTELEYLDDVSAAKSIIDGRFIFDDVDPLKKQGVADALIALERKDLITDPEFLPVEMTPIETPEQLPAE